MVDCYICKGCSKATDHSVAGVCDSCGYSDSKKLVALTNIDAEIKRLRELCKDNCGECGKVKDCDTHVRYGNDLDNPVKHNFVSESIVTVGKTDVLAILDALEETRKALQSMLFYAARGGQGVFPPSLLDTARAALGKETNAILPKG